MPRYPRLSKTVSKNKTSFIIGITGSTGSGKTTFAKSLQKELGEQAVLLASDMYYKDQSCLPLGERFKQNMDQPQAFNNQLLVSHIKKLASGEDIRAPIYDFTDHTRKEGTCHLEAKPIVIVEGLLIFCKFQLRSLFDLKIFLEVDADLRVCHRVLRDVAERRDGSVESAIKQYLFSARPMDKIYVSPQKKYADLVIDWNEEDLGKVRKLARKILKLASSS